MNNDQLLAHYISMAEKRFGPRCYGWEIAPVEVDRDSYPETICDAAIKCITVHITNSTSNHPEQARYQLAHEAIHCLFASGKRNTIYFEEGLACEFALTVKDIPQRYRAQACLRLRTPLKEPRDAFRALKAKDEAIRRLRKQCPDVDRLTSELVQQVFAVSEQIAVMVCRRMPQERPETM